MNIQNIEITEGVRDFPHISPVATRDEIEVVKWYIEALMKNAADCANEARAMVDKLNECLPVKKVSTLALDDVRGCFTDVIEQIAARPDMIREAREFDR